MLEDKAQIKKDILSVIKLNQQVKYADTAYVQKVLDMIAQKGMLQTVYGKRYIAKLERIIAGERVETCIFCAGECKANSVICDTCLQKLMPKQTPQESKKTELVQAKQAASVQADQTVTTNSNKIKKKNLKAESLNRKNIIILTISLVILIAAIATKEIETFFAGLFCIALINLIICFIKKKPRKIAIVITTVLFVLTGITNIFSLGKDSDEFSSVDAAVAMGDTDFENLNADDQMEGQVSNNTCDFANYSVSPEDILMAYKKSLIDEANSAATFDKEITVDYELVSRSERGDLLYGVNFLGARVAAIKIIVEGKKVIGVSAACEKIDKLSALVWISFVKTFNPGKDEKEIEGFIAGIIKATSDGEQNRLGDYFWDYQITNSNGTSLHELQAMPASMILKK